jgi:RNA polymerase sigma factor (sigma-70 family)
LKQEPPDNAAFLQLIQENKAIIYKICRSYCANRDDRDDLAQEIIYQLWKSGNRFDYSYKFSTWMYRVALNVAISFYRKGKKHSHIIPLEMSHQDMEEDLPDDVHSKENIYLLHRCIAELKALDKALILLYFEEKPYKEIADIIGISETNVATKLNRIKEKIKQQLLTIKKETNER